MNALSHLKLNALLYLLSVVSFCVAPVVAATPEDMIAAHNAVRTPLHSPPLTWSASLADRAQAWAAKLIETGSYTPRNDGQFGENLFEIVGGAATPKQVVDAWAAESANYDAAAGKCRGRCGHFTQVVWRTTKKVGCGTARRGPREVWVCDYDPPGNIVGERPY